MLSYYTKNSLRSLGPPLRRADAVVIFLLNLMILDDFGIGKKSGAPGAPYPWQQHETL